MPGRSLPPVIARLLMDNQKFSEGADDTKAEMRDVADTGDEEFGRLDDRISGFSDSSALSMAKVAMASQDLRSDLVQTTSDFEKSSDGIGNDSSRIRASLGNFSFPAPTLLAAIGSVSPALVGLGSVAAGLGVGLAASVGAAAAGLEVFKLASGQVATQFEANAKTILTSWQTAMAPIVQPVYTQALGLVKQGLGDLTPIVGSVSLALQGVEKQLGATLASPAVKAGFAQLGAQAQGAIGAFGGLATNAVPAVLNLFHAMNPLADVVEQLVNTLGPKLPSMAAAMQGPFNTLAGILTTLGPKVGDLLGTVGHLAGGIVGALQPLAGPALDLLNNVGKALQPVVGALGDVLKAVAPLLEPVGRLAPLIGSLLTDAIHALVPVITAVAGPLGDLLNQLGPILGPIIKSLNPALQEFGQQMGQSLGQVLKAIVPVVLDLVKALVPLLPSLTKILLNEQLLIPLKLLTPILVGVADAIGALEPVINTVIGVFSDVAGWVAGLTDNLGSLGDIVDTVGDALGSFFSTVGGAFANIGSTIANAAGTVLRFFTQLPGQVWSAITGGFGQVIGFFTALPGRILAELAALPGQLATLAGDAIGAMVVGLLTAVVGLWKFWTDLVPKAVGYLADLGSDLLQIGGDALTSLLDGATAAAAAVFDFYKKLPGRIVSGIGDVTHLLTQAGTDVIDGLFNAVTTAASTGWHFFTNLPSNIVHGIGSLADTLTSAGTDLVNGLFNAVTATLSKAWSTFTNLPSTIVKGIGSLAKTLFSAGQDLLSGFIDGIGSMAGKLIDAIKSTITDHLPGFVKSALGISSPSKVFAEIGANVMSGLALGITSNGSLPTNALAQLHAELSSILTPATMALVGEDGEPETVITDFRLDPSQFLLPTMRGLLR